MDSNRNSSPEPGRKDTYGAAADFVIAAVLLAFSVFVLIEAVRMPIRGGKLILSPGFIPTATASALVLLSLALLVSTAKQKGPQRIPGWLKFTLASEGFRRWCCITLLTGLYVFFVGRVHFALLTFLYLASLLFYLKASDRKVNIRSTVMVLATALGATLLVALAVPWLFNIQLP